MNSKKRLQATDRRQVIVQSALKVFARKDLDDPVIFNPTKPMGYQYPNLGDFKDLNLEDYITLEPIKTLPAGYS